MKIEKDTLAFETINDAADAVRRLRIMPYLLDRFEARRPIYATRQKGKRGFIRVTRYYIGNRQADCFPEHKTSFLSKHDHEAKSI